MWKKLKKLFKPSKKDKQELVSLLTWQSNSYTFTVAEIQDFISNRKYENAQTALEDYEPKKISEEKIKVLYEEMESNMWSAVKKTKPNCMEGCRLLALVYNVTKNEDARDETLRMKTERMPPGRPREWGKQFTKLVEEYVETEISKLEYSVVENYLPKVKKAVSNDLEKLRLFLKENKIIHIYEKSYHACIFQHLDQMVQRNLEAEDLFYIFKWVMCKCESKEILDKPCIQHLTMNGSELHSSLQTNWEKHLKKAVQSEVKEIITKFGKKDVSKKDPLSTIKEDALLIE
ncbi:uncharacterized protein LOC103175380 [Callorhinchus milii]|uniref:uncharacterized protein LOC103175380 n=1 Tax=Callorhinchus milii TaxID=7868 RepID=UPI000457368C|nr:uncharacterized protein LOC103175380 [Callorhinchus milii]|eukprot:gi/632942749/ref/XP_007886579.1/ PREDICTED: uncharacterized protein LOC103175380 [Callorhinchus milii]